MKSAELWISLTAAYILALAVLVVPFLRGLKQGPPDNGTLIDGPGAGYVEYRRGYDLTTWTADETADETADSRSSHPIKANRDARLISEPLPTSQAGTRTPANAP